MRCRRETFLARFRLTLKYAFFFPLLLPLRFNFLWPVFPHVIPSLFGVREPCPRVYGLTPSAIPSCLTFSVPSAASGSVLCLLPVPAQRFAFPRRQMTCTQLPLPRHHFLDRRRQHRIAFHRRRPFHSRQLP